MPRTKSILFDDDVMETFLPHPWSPFSINHFITVWKKGKASTELTRKAILQAFAALSGMRREHGGKTQEEIKATFLLLKEHHPELWEGEEVNG